MGKTTCSIVLCTFYDYMIKFGYNVLFFVMNQVHTGPAESKHVWHVVDIFRYMGIAGYGSTYCTSIVTHGDAGG